MLALQGQQVLLGHQRAGVHVAAGHHVGDQAGDVEIVGADEAAVAHAHQLGLDGGLGVAAGHREAGLERRAPVGGRHGLDLRQRDEQQLILVRHHHVVVQQVAQRAALDRAGAHLGHGRGLEGVLQAGQQVLRTGQRGLLGGAAGDVGQATTTGDQAHTHFHQAHITFHVGDALGAGDGDLTATAQRQATHRGHGGHAGVADAQQRVLQLLDLGRDALGAQLHEGGQHGFQVGAGREGLVRRPDHQAVVLAFGQLDALEQALHHARADQVHLAGDAGDQHLAVQRPQPHLVVLEDLGAAGDGRHSALTAQLLGEVLALVDRQRAARPQLAGGGIPRTVGRVHARNFGDWAVEHPGRQRRVAQRLAGVDVGLHPLGHLGPAGFLPQLERALLHAKAPAHGQVHLAGAVGDAGQVHRHIVEGIAVDRPQELRLRVARFTQQLQPLGRGLLQDAVDQRVGLAAAGHVVALGQVKAQDVLAHLLVEAGLGLLAQRAGPDQRGDGRRRGVGGVERVVVQVVLQRLDDVGHGVKAHHVGGAEGAAAGPAQLLAGQVVDHVVAEAKVLGLLDRGQHAGDAHAVGHEVGGVLGADHAFAQRAGGEGLQLVQDLRAGARGRDQFNQLHVTRRVEEMDAAETGLDRLGQHLGQFGDRQPGGVAGDDGVWRDVRRHLGVEVELPVHALGDGLDDEVTAGQQVQVLVVVGGLDQRQVTHHADRAGLELLQPVQGLQHDAVLRAFFGGQVKQHHRHLDVDQVGRDLRAHHAGAEHGHLADVEFAH